MKRDKKLAESLGLCIYFLSCWAIPEIDKIIKDTKLKEPYSTITRKVLWEKVLRERLLVFL